MKRIRVMPLKVFTAFSLVLSSLTIFLWGWSLWNDDSITYSVITADGQRRTDRTFSSGLCQFGLRKSVYTPNVQSSNPPIDTTLPQWRFERYSPFSETDVRTLESFKQIRHYGLGRFRWLNVECESQLVRGNPLHEVSRVIAVPHLILLVVFAVLPLRRLICVVQMRGREKIGLCSTCGYDLRATSDRCPECGTVTPVGSIQTKVK